MHPGSKPPLIINALSMVRQLHSVVQLAVDQGLQYYIPPWGHTKGALWVTKPGTQPTLIEHRFKHERLNLPSTVMCWNKVKETSVLLLLVDNGLIHRCFLHISRVAPVTCQLQTLAVYKARSHYRLCLLETSNNNECGKILVNVHHSMIDL
jgi:hypothetical protein